MNQVKIFFKTGSYQLQNDINAWVKENHIIIVSVSYSVVTNGMMETHRALVVYMEE